MRRGSLVAPVHGRLSAPNAKLACVKLVVGGCERRRLRLDRLNLRQVDAPERVTRLPSRSAVGPRPARAARSVGRGLLAAEPRLPRRPGELC